jgi:hypothetical protein
VFWFNTAIGLDIVIRLTRMKRVSTCRAVGILRMELSMDLIVFVDLTRSGEYNKEVTGTLSMKF